jgi:UDP-N-acetylbacillosamine N-acetyltransferase
MCKDKIYIYGGSGHGLVVADIARACGYKEILFIDDGENNYSTFEKIKNNKHIPIIIAIGNNQIEVFFFKKLLNMDLK